MSAFFSGVISRSFSTSSVSRIGFTAGAGSRGEPENANKLFFRRVQLFNKRHCKAHKKMLFLRFEKPNAYPDIPIHNYGCRGTGIRHAGVWQPVPEMVPELVVPRDMKDCKLRPYVSYRTKEIFQEALTAKDVFNAVYGQKILKDFKEGKLDDEGNPLEPSREEVKTADEAWVEARKTGSDIFVGGVPVSKKFKVRWEYK